MQVQKAKAAILAESRKPLIVDEIEFPQALDVGQVLVKVLHTSICGSQINEIAAAKGEDKWLPHLLGHEASAMVIETGPGVSTVTEGDTVVMHWRPGTGIDAPPASYRWQGKRLNAGKVTTFNEYAVVSENRLTAIPESYDLKVAPLLGCAVTTAMGVINNDAEVKIGESVIVFGAGGIGINTVQFASAVAAYPVVAVDVLDDKLTMASAYGATHCINSKNLADLGKAIRDIVGQDGADKVIETTGIKSVIELAYDVTHADGTCVLVGVPNENVSLYTLPLHFNKVLTGSHGGECRPDIDIPRIIRLDRAGRISFDGIITHEFSLDDINAALDLVRSGEAGRVLLNIGHA